MCMRDGISQDVPLGLGYPRMSQDVPDVLGHLGLGHVYERWVSQDVPLGLGHNAGYPRMSQDVSDV